MKNIAQQMLAQIEKAIRIVITTHVNPDGDGYCAALALQKIIQVLGKNSLIVTDNDDLARYEFLLSDDSACVQQFSTLTDAQSKPYDLAIVLDCNSYDRIGERRIIVDKANYVALFDHHVLEHEPIKADLSIIEPTYVSAGAIVYELFKPQILAMNVAERIYVANCIYTTILNDTNNFSNANTNSAVFILAAELSDIGSKAHELYKEYFMNHAAEEMRYVGETLATIELHNSRRVLTMYSTMEMMQRNQLNPDSVMNITRWVQGVKGVDAIVYLREDAPGLFKLSLRSVKLNVNKIAISYGGGGHRQASGCTVKGQLDEIKTKLLHDFSMAIAEFDEQQ